MPVGVHNTVPKNKRDAFINLVKPNILFPREASYWAKVFFTEFLDYNAAAQTILTTTPAVVFKVALEALHAQNYNFIKLAEFVKQHAGVKGKALFQPLRVALTGDLHGPEMTTIAEFLGVEKMIPRTEAV
jgi:nondiscriminating glutamyl-tRNA synthetase